MAKNTHTLYNKAWTTFTSFCNAIAMPAMPADTVTVALFITDMNNRQYASGSIRTFISAIAYHHKIRLLPDPTASFLIQKTLIGLSKLNPPQEARLPITITILHYILEINTIICHDPYLSLLFGAMLLTAFYALCRVSEITDGEHNLLCHNVAFSTDGQKAIITFQTFKHSITKQSVTMYHQPAYCPCTTLRNFCQMRPKHNPYLFVTQEGKPISRLCFTNYLKRLIMRANLDPKSYTSHSLRIGGATYAARLGMSKLQIQRLGRWKSDAFLKYLRW